MKNFRADHSCIQILIFRVSSEKMFLWFKTSSFHPLHHKKNAAQKYASHLFVALVASLRHNS